MPPPNPLMQPRAWLALATVLWAAGFVFAPCDAQPINASQAVFLRDSQKAWNQTFVNWEVGADCANAEGLMCDGSGMITEITLCGIYSNSNWDPPIFGGSIPNSISSLTSLVRLSLTNCGIGGPIPAGIGNLSSLNYLDLAFNQFSGPIPVEIGSLTNLIELDLDLNSLTGSIPNTITRLTNLYHVDLSNNVLTGSIPNSISSLTALYILYLSYNNLTGSIPNSISSLVNLKFLDLSNNALTGSIPNSISSLEFGHLDVAENHLNGTIPPSLGASSTINVTGTNLTCPPDNTDCETRQDSISGFCLTCRSFCMTCGKPAGE
ncbi:unnamed protein product [Closterium sp. NIES-54]